MCLNLKSVMRRRVLAKWGSNVPTSITSLSQLHTAVAFLDVSDASYKDAVEELTSFFWANGIQGKFVYFDFRKLDSDSQLLTERQRTVTADDLNWFGCPAREILDMVEQDKPDLLISLLRSSDFAVDFLAKCSRAKFKIGRVQLPGKTFDLVVNDKRNGNLRQVEIFREMLNYFENLL